MAVGRFLAGIAAVIYSPLTYRYLILRRAEEKDFGAGIWECLTGRLDQGEGFEEALHREVLEELGVSVHPVHILGTTHFYRGASIAENELVGVVYLCMLDESASISISTEHSEFRWLDYQQAVHLLSASDPSTRWARRVIERAERILPLVSAQLSDFQKGSRLELD